MIYTEQEIEALYKDALSEAHHRLSAIPVARGRIPSVRGLGGWIYEQTIRSCIEDELNAEGRKFEIHEQVRLHGRARLDLVIGNIAIEIKHGGIFGKSDADKYRVYREKVESMGKRYLYLTAQESHQPFRDMAVDIFGAKNAFFLDTPGSWQRFVEAVARTDGLLDE